MMQCKNILDLKYPGKYPGLKYPRQKYPGTKISLTENIPNKNILVPKYPTILDEKYNYKIYYYIYYYHIYIGLVEKPPLASLCLPLPPLVYI